MSFPQGNGEYVEAGAVFEKLSCGLFINSRRQRTRKLTKTKQNKKRYALESTTRVNCKNPDKCLQGKTESLAKVYTDDSELLGRNPHTLTNRKDKRESKGTEVSATAKQQED